MTYSGRLALSRPLTPPDIPAIELVSTTRRDEARSAMALVGSLQEHSVPAKDIAVVVRDLENYEEPLYRAALQYGVTPTFWTQLRVTRTRPYALVESVCEVLGADEPSLDVLLRPLEHRWSPAHSSGEWPVEPAEVRELKQEFSSESHSISDWLVRFRSENRIDERIETYLDWLDDVPEPTPEIIKSRLDDVVTGYLNNGVPVTQQNDSKALLKTETDARAVVRMEKLVQQLGNKFADRLDDGTLERSWADLSELVNVIATQRPGSRNHSHARAVDVFEANDIWLLDIPYLIIVGMTADEWPKDTESTIPPEFQNAVLEGDGAVGKLAPRTSWTEGRDRDHFADALRAAGHCVVLTRHTETADGQTVPPSPFLEYVDTEGVSDSDWAQLMSSECELPPVLREVLLPEGGAPEDPEVPEASEVPEDVEDSEVPEVPEDPKEPEVSEVPEVPEDPEVSQYE